MLRQLLEYWGEFFAEVARRGVYIDNCILLGLYLFHKVFLGEVSDGRESSQGDQEEDNDEERGYSHMWIRVRIIIRNYISE